MRFPDPLGEADRAFATATNAAQRAARLAQQQRAAARDLRTAGAEAGPPSLRLDGANPRQASALAAAAEELAQREAEPAAIRGWRRLSYPGAAPPGSRPVAMLLALRPDGQSVRLVVDPRGTLRSVEAGNRIGGPITVAEAAARARGG
jgi:hypothetical protein